MWTRALWLARKHTKLHASQTPLKNARVVGARVSAVGLWNDYMWEFAKFSGPRGKKNEQTKTTVSSLGKDNGRNQIEGFFFSNNFDLRGSAEVAATGGTRRVHHFTHEK